MKRPAILKLTRVQHAQLLTHHEDRMERARQQYGTRRPLCPDHYCPGRICGCRNPVKE